ncbi:MAG: glycosyltransferase family 2 protein, partial [Gemmatimonadetes bacterium]|nr:glycosyltransferase family 2 protein [Gemmatimonadota bacterium]
MRLSLVSPVYLAEDLVAELVDQTSAVLGEITDDYEILLVEDGSPDGSWTEISRACAQNEHVRGVRLSRNYGQHTAIRAGIDRAQDDYVIVMDCDLQDDPSYIPIMLDRALEGYEIVHAKRGGRRHPIAKSAISRIFHRLFNIVSGSRSTDYQVGCFSLISRKVVEGYRLFQ